jgi:diguanylate cyclase
MQYPEPPEKASKFALAAFKRLNELGIAANPINFAIWYEYFAGKNHDLKKTVDALVVSDGSPDMSVYADLYDRFIIAGANIARDREWSDRIDTVTERIVSALTASGSETEEYGAALKTFSGDLKTAENLDQIRGLVADIVAETESMDSRTRDLYSRVTKSTEEISELRKALDDSRRDALTDSLTGVANRKCFDQKIFAAVEEALANDETLSLIFADIDHFKDFNDNHGHQLGDQVLRLVGRTLYNSLKGKDTAARYGGEEFAIILPDTTSGGATAVAENIRKSIASKRLVKKGSDREIGAITVSFGVTSLHAGEEISGFIERADQALYMAKKLGRNRVICEDKRIEIAAVGA